ncbi:MAG: hypothetical protein AAFU54_16545 [Chloroflexota bacterium]
MDEKINALAELFMETGHAHHQAYIETDGADDDWAIWYANYLHEKMADHIGVTSHRSELVYLLMHMSYLQAMDAPSAKWPRYYAKYLLERYL